MVSRSIGSRACTEPREILFPQSAGLHAYLALRQRQSGWSPLWLTGLLSDTLEILIKLELFVVFKSESNRVSYTAYLN